jgi:hypothetical protein
VTREKSSQHCWDQATDCYNTAPPTGDEFCRAWESKCDAIQATCEVGGSGPPNAGVSLNPPAKILNPVPVPLGPTVVGGSAVAGPTGTPAAQSPAPPAPAAASGQLAAASGGSSNPAPAPAAYAPAVGIPAAAPREDKRVGLQPSRRSRARSWRRTDTPRLRARKRRALPRRRAGTRTTSTTGSSAFGFTAWHD